MKIQRVSDIDSMKEIVAELQAKNGTRIRVGRHYKLKEIVFMYNGCCPDLPVFLTTNKRPDGKTNYSCQCACNGWCTTGCTTAEDAIDRYWKMNVSKSIREKKNSYEYQRLMDILEDYWLTEPEEDYVRIEAYFRKSDGSEQGKVITWGSPEHFKNTPRENHRLIRAKDVLRMKGEKHEECEPPAIFGYPG